MLRGCYWSADQVARVYPHKPQLAEICFFQQFQNGVDVILSCHFCIPSIRFLVPACVIILIDFHRCCKVFWCFPEKSPQSFCRYFADVYILHKTMRAYYTKPLKSRNVFGLEIYEFFPRLRRFGAEKWASNYGNVLKIKNPAHAGTWTGSNKKLPRRANAGRINKNTGGQNHGLYGYFTERIFLLYRIR